MIKFLSLQVENHMGWRNKLPKIRMSEFLSGMSLPSRLALWLGVGMVAWGYMDRQMGIMVIGSLFIVVGAVLWWLYKVWPWWIQRRQFRARSKPPITLDASSKPRRTISSQLKHLDEQKQAAEAKKNTPAISAESSAPNGFLSEKIQQAKQALVSLQAARDKMGWKHDKQ